MLKISKMISQEQVFLIKKLFNPLRNRTVLFKLTKFQKKELHFLSKKTY